MKFNVLKATFKNGMVSPRLRGREKDGDLTSSAEKIENFIVDKVGGLFKRGALQAPLKQPFTNNATHALNYDTSPIADTVPTKYFSATLRGRDFIFRFNTSVAFNTIKNLSPQTVSDYQSTFLTVIDPLTGNAKDCRPYSPAYYVGSNNTSINGDLLAFDKTDTSPTVTSTLLQSYLSYQICSPTHMTKVSDATVVFSCNNGTMSFSVSLINLPATAGSSVTSEVFVLLPYFINTRAFVANLGKLTTAADYYCPISPINFPFNSINTNKALTVQVSLDIGQSGTLAADGVVSVPSNKLLWELTVKQSMSVSPDGSNNPLALMGKFISIPNTANTKDVVFFITWYKSATSTEYRFSCIQITGGIPEANSTKWKVSSFGGESHPKVVAYCFGRLLYANAGINVSRWWASATHPSNPTDFQSFMQFSLAQDVSSDSSKLGYEGIAPASVKTNYVDYGITDPFRYGFTATVPNLSPISFIESRNKIHIGTLGGECQLIVANGDFNKASFDQTIIRTNSATAYPACTGDGKFFYISNKGKDIRFISTEDKYYESQDGLMTTSLEGLGIQFNKILWFEEINSIIALSSTNRLFFITVHEDTGIKAVTELTSSFELRDFCVSYNKLFVIINYKGYQHICEYITDKDIYADLKGRDALEYEVFPFYLGETVNVLYQNVVYLLDIPLDGVVPIGDFPFDVSEVSPENPMYVYGSTFKSKIRTLPFAEGANGGSSVGLPTRVDRVTVQVDSSGPFDYGMEGGTLFTVEGLDISKVQTKYVTFDMPQSTEIENHLYIESSAPTPLNISGVALRGVSYEGE